LGPIPCAALALRHLGEGEAAAAVEGAVQGALAEGVTTRDLGGTSGTEEVGTWIADALGG